MKLEDIRRIADTEPFEPFYLVTSAGQWIEVPHRDFISFSPVSRWVVVFDRGGGARNIDAMHITELVAGAKIKRRRKKNV